METITIREARRICESHFGVEAYAVNFMPGEWALQLSWTTYDPQTGKPQAHNVGLRPVNAHRHRVFKSLDSLHREASKLGVTWIKVGGAPPAGDAHRQEALL